MLRGRKAVRYIDARRTFASTSFVILAINPSCAVSQTLTQRVDSLEATFVQSY